MNGFLLVDKPAGIAFSSVIKAVKRKFGLDKVGHGGSLDTMASGLFIVLLGDANKFAADVMGADRAFEGSFKLGLNTNTGDIHGEISGPGAATIDPAKVKGDIFQREPRYCSIRKEGKADYEVVDTGEHPEFMAHVYRLELDGNAFRLKCTARTIVRALAQELGVALASLRRTAIGKFKVEAAVPFARLLEMGAEEFAKCVMPLAEALR